MLTKIKMFNIKLMDEYYTTMYRYWSDEAEGCIKLGRYEKADYCVDMSIKYLDKEANLLVRAFGMA